MMLADYRYYPALMTSLKKTGEAMQELAEVTAKALQAPEYIPEILGQHHGFSPNVVGKSAQGENFGGDTWQAERQKLVEALPRSVARKLAARENYATARLLGRLDLCSRLDRLWIALR